jgi:hypothetical protein
MKLKMLRRPQLVQAKPRHRRQEESLRRVDLRLTLPTDPGFLHHVLRTPHLAEHPIGQGKHRGPMRLERGGAVVHAVPRAIRRCTGPERDAGNSGSNRFTA